MRTRLIVLAIIVMLAAAISATAQAVTSNFLKGVNFANFKTYKWERVADKKYPEAELDAKVVRAIDSQLSQKGLTKVTEGPSDLVVTYQLAIDREEVWSPFGGTGYRINMESVKSDVGVISIGTLALDMYDTAGKRRVWTGSAIKQIDPKRDPANDQEKLNKAMAKLLQKYPPPSKK